MNKIKISLQNLFESDVSLEKVGLKTGVSTVILDEYRRGLKSWRKMPLGVLDSGLEGMYDDVYGLSDSVSESVSGFIIDVLSTYNDVGWRYGNLSEIQKENLNPAWIVFGGFSREFERRHYEACNSIVNRLDMFPTVSYKTDEAGNRNLLSETEMVGYYRRLLRNYECCLKNVDDASNDVTFSALRKIFER